MVEGRILDAVDAHDGIEGAALAFVGEFDAFDVIGRSARRFGDVENVLGGDVDELRLRIDEAPDQPRTGDAVDFRALARDPLARRRAYGSVRWQTLCSPAGDAILEIRCVDARRAESRCHALADLVSVNAVHDHLAAARQLFSPLLHLARVTMVGRDDEPARG